MELFLQQVVNGLVLGSAYSLVALGLFVVYNILHIPNFAHGELFTLGAYIQYSLVVTVGLPFLAALVVTGVAIAVLGLVLERTMFTWLRRADAPLPTVLIATLALGIIIQQVIYTRWGSAPVAIPAPISGVVDVGGVRMSDYRLSVVGATLLIAAILALVVYQSGFGKKMRALAQNRDLAEVSGIGVRLVGALAFMVACGIAGVAGALLAPTTPLEATMGFHPMLVAFVIVIVIGGGGRLSAVLAGGFVVAIVETLTAGYIANALRDAVVFVFLVLFLIIRPEGAVRQAAADRARL